MDIVLLVLPLCLRTNLYVLYCISILLISLCLVIPNGYQPNRSSSQAKIHTASQPTQGHNISYSTAVPPRYPSPVQNVLSTGVNGEHLKGSPLLNGSKTPPVRHISTRPPLSSNSMPTMPVPVSNVLTNAQQLPPSQYSVRPPMSNPVSQGLSTHNQSTQPGNAG